MTIAGTELNTIRAEIENAIPVANELLGQLSREDCAHDNDPATYRRVLEIRASLNSKLTHLTHPSVLSSLGPEAQSHVAEINALARQWIPGFRG